MKDILWITIEILTNIIEVYLLFELCNYFLFKIIEKRYIYTIIIFLFSLVLFNLNYIFKNETLYYIISYTMLFLAILFLFKERFYKKVLVFNAYILLVSVLEFLTLGILYLTLKCDVTDFYNQSTIRFIGIIISKLLLFILVKLFILKKPKREEYINNEIVYPLIIFSILCLGIIIGTSVGLYDTSIDKEDFIPIFSLTVALVCIIFFIIYEKVQKQLEKQRKVETANEHLRLVNKYSTDINKIIQDYRILKHDFIQHICCIDGLIKTKNYNKLQKYIDAYKKEQSSINEILFTDNVEISALLNYKLTVARKSNISIKTNIEIPEGIKFNNIVLITLLGNLIDNSIEACARLENTEKFIFIVIIYINKKLFIKIENPIEDQIEEVDGRYKTSKDDKKNHGLGLISVKNIVEKYKGELNIEQNHYKFTVKVIIAL